MKPEVVILRIKVSSEEMLRKKFVDHNRMNELIHDKIVKGWSIYCVPDIIVGKKTDDHLNVVRIKMRDIEDVDVESAKLLYEKKESPRNYILVESP